MGITGLLPVLKEITHPVRNLALLLFQPLLLASPISLIGTLMCPQTHVSEYRGHRVAVDAYCWLHRGAYSCSAELCEGQATDRCLQMRTLPLSCTS